MNILKVFFLTLCLMLVLTASAFAQMSNVGFVNPQRIINESKLGKIAQDDLAQLGKEKDRRVREAMRDVEALQKVVKSDNLSTSQQQLKEKALRQAVRHYERLVENSNLELQAEERRLIKFVMRRADAILQAIARQNGFKMILTDPEIIGYVDNSLDITDQVIKQLNSMM